MTSTPTSMLIVAGHAIWDGKDWNGIEKSRFPDPEAMKKTISQHVEYGCEMVVNGQYDTLAFSGGRSRKGLSLSEAEGMLNFANLMKIVLPKHVILETRARDSFENVFFSLLAFHQQFNGAWPKFVGVLSMPHKSIRFMLMAAGLRIKDFVFHGHGKVDPLELNCENEMQNMNSVLAGGKVSDPLLRGMDFVRKRIGRTPPHYYAKPQERGDGDNAEEDTAYLNDAGSSYANAGLATQVANCDPHGGWRQLNWPW